MIQHRKIPLSLNALRMSLIVINNDSLKIYLLSFYVNLVDVMFHSFQAMDMDIDLPFDGVFRIFRIRDKCE